MAEDRELWKEIVSGNGDVFDTWYRETAPRLLAFLRHVLGNEHAAEDVMQETFTQIWRHPERFDPERGSARAYLFGVARRQAAEWLRKQKPSSELDFELPARGGIENASIISDAFSRLTVEQRTLLWLREVEGQSYAELGMILDVPIGTIRSRLFSAREALRGVWCMASPPSGGRHGM